MVARLKIFVCLSMIVLGVPGVQAEEQTAKPGTGPEMQDLGDDRFQVGNIIVDKAARKFTVPGKVLRLEPPLEYLAVTKGGAKGYESLLELETSAVEFNLACILIGLSNEDVTPPRYQFDQEPVIGPKVRVMAILGQDEKQVEVNAEELILIDGEIPGPAEWVYTGSFERSGTGETYMAEFAGTLIGLVHDPASVIEHRTGLGIGAYGSMSGNTELPVSVGTQLTVTVENVDSE